MCTPSAFATVDLGQLGALELAGPSTRKLTDGWHTLRTPSAPTVSCGAGSRPRPPHTLTSLPIGRPLPGVWMGVLDPGGGMRAMPPGGVGELYVGGVGLAAGYLRDPSLTDDKFPVYLAGSNRDAGDLTGTDRNWWTESRAQSPQGEVRIHRTGDLARINPATGCLELLGRLDSQVQVHGKRVDLLEVETVLGMHPRVAAAAATLGTDGRIYGFIVQVDGPRWHRREARKSAVDTGAAQLQDAPGRPERGAAGDVKQWARTQLPEHAAPAEVVVVAEIPRTASSGKVYRAGLPEMPKRAPSRVEEAHPLRDREVGSSGGYRDCLGDAVRSVARAAGVAQEAVQEASDFFDLGGTSIGAADVALDLGVAMETVYACRTPRALAAHMRTAPCDQCMAITEADRRSSQSPPPPPQALYGDTSDTASKRLRGAKSAAPRGTRSPASTTLEQEVAEGRIFGIAVGRGSRVHTLRCDDEELASTPPPGGLGSGKQGGSDSRGGPDAVTSEEAFVRAAASWLVGRRPSGEPRLMGLPATNIVGRERDAERAYEEGHEGGHERFLKGGREGVHEKSLKRGREGVHERSHEGGLESGDQGEARDAMRGGRLARSSSDTQCDAKSATSAQPPITDAAPQYSAGSPGDTREDSPRVVTGEILPALEMIWRVRLGKCVDASPLLLLRFAQHGCRPRRLPPGWPQVAGDVLLTERASGEAEAATADVRHGAAEEENRELEASWVVVVGSHAGNVLCADADTGRVLWEVRLGERIESSATATRDGRCIVVGCYDVVATRAA
ncbi:hypothetical protein CYMTET_31197 [Cymbomonas tetramitiformis]|uniref:Carrier domain-containing protein n=1 Tax=Cymbomonas tetramitiformis TaxID=36881 RepID=A0AAE0KTE1_9CHLO|nr:hypothetical protein CYMTET_31197 [Cymbomonas tetramitiformis]